MLKKVKLSLRDLGIQTKVKRAVEYANRIVSNSFFTKPEPAPQEIILAADKLNRKNNELLTARTKAAEIKEEMKILEKELDKKITRLAFYVENQAMGNEEIIRSAGMEIRNNPIPLGIPGKTILNAAVTEKEGEIKLKWDRVKGAKIFNIEVSKTGKNEQKWKTIESTTKTRILLKDLSSGTKYWFRIQAIGAGGKGPYCDPVSKFVP
jgi:hypothetical protein